jgi:DHA1 family quinolone resistance protein-like MFS transporter
MNKKLLLLIFSDILILGGFGLIAPIFAVFINNDLIGGSLVTAGLATTIFLAVKCSIQLPLSKYFVDKHNHKARFLVIGTSLIVLVPFIYIAAKSIYVIFIAQAIYGLGAALAYPAWFSLFTIYMDKKQRGFEYSIYTTSVGIGAALAAFFGAQIAELLGFRTLFFIVGFISFIGFLFLVALYRLEMKKARSNSRHPFNRKRK